MGRREVLAIPMLAWFASETAEACSISNPAFGMVESVQVFLGNLFAGDHAAVLDLLDDSFRFNRVSDFEQNISGKVGFANYLNLSRPIEKKLSTYEVMLKGHSKLVQHEFWKFQDKPEYQAGSCGFAFNRKSIMAVYEFYPFNPPPIVLPPPSSINGKTKAQHHNKKSVPANNFSKIKSLMHVELS